jgi:glycosyltransferase involved in cell wall biosynthesis
MLTEKKKVLMMADWFSPGFKAGGPIQSCVNFSQHLKDDLDIYVLTTDRDLNDTLPYNGIIQDQWTDFNSRVKVFYASPSWLSFTNIKKLISQLRPDVLYLNSMYSRFFSIYPLLLKRMGHIQTKIILSPRGMLRQSAIEFSRMKKLFFLRLFRLANMHKQVLFHCTDETEINDVSKFFGKAPSVLLSNFPSYQQPLVLPSGKKRNELKILFVGRIHPIKNLDYLLKALRPLDSQVELTIVASVEEQEYWKRCEELIKQLPSNIKIIFKGELPNEEVKQMLQSHDIFALPTKGENFGHAIFESLSAGRPVVISDQTPWKRLSQWKAGWDISLDDHSKFTEVLRQFSCMNQEELNEWCVGAWKFAHDYIHQSDLKKRYLEVFG